MRTKVVTACAVAALASALPAVAVAGPGLKAGMVSAGAGAEYELGRSEGFGIRVRAYGLQYDGSTMGKPYHIGTTGIALVADWRPRGAAWSLTRTATANTLLAGDAAPPAVGAATLGTEAVAGADPRAEARIQFGQGLAPYVGVGITATPRSLRGLRLNAGLGIAILGRDAGTGGSWTHIGPPHGNPDRGALEQSARREQGDLNGYPVVTFGAMYSF